ncbi:MAG: S8 family serine peptidase, partial [Gammaproteobacteria bacterium]
VYAVQLKGASLAAYDGSMKGMAAPARSKSGRIDVRSKEARQYTAALKSRQDMIIQSVGAKRLYNYVYGMNGFSAIMTPEQVSTLKRNPEVLTIWKDELRQPQTDTSRAYIGLSEPGALHGDGVRAFGEDIVIGVVDSGAFPENLSFSNLGCPADGDPVEDPLNQVFDCGGPVDVYGEPPEQWNAELNEPGSCQFGNTGFNPADVAFECNGKLLAARAYGDAFKAFTPLIPTEYDSARDSDGHGSHTASTAGGNANVPASLNGTAQGNISGMAPRARIAVYKSCWDGEAGSGCFGSDSAAAFEQAYFDGVDVINFSVGGGSTYFGGPEDAIALFLNDAGVFFANSNGNSGPAPATVGTSGAPWWTSVGAMQDDAVFNGGVWITPPGQFSPELFESVESGSPVQVSDIGFFNSNLSIPEDPANWTGCAPWVNDAGGMTAMVGRGACSFQDKFDNAAAAGAPAILVFNDRGGLSGMSVPTGTIPGLMIFQQLGIDIYNGIINGVAVNTLLDPNASVSKDATMAGFSSRGPNRGFPDIIKPDVSAPGVNILAAGAGLGQIQISGTSMASPHVAGLGAGLRQRHQGSWQSSWFKSSMMTTARNGIENDGVDGVHMAGDKATPFDVGAGQIVSGERANGNSLKPGLIYANSLIDHQAALCGEPAQAGLVDPAFCASLEASGVSTDPSDLNLASIGIAELSIPQTVKRTVTCTDKADGARTWTAKVTQPPGVTVTVDPTSISCERLGTADYTVTFETNENTVFNEWAHGRLVWIADDNSRVRSPISIRPIPFAAPSDVEGIGTEGSATIPVVFGYDGTYMATMDGLVAGQSFEGAVADGDADLYFFDVPEGTTLLTVQISDADVGAGDGSDDLDLQLFGPGPDFPFICGSGSGTSAERCDIPNAAAGEYAFFVIDFASAEGPTPYTAFAYSQDGLDAGNTVVTAPAAATPGADSVTVDWAGLTEGTKYRGALNHSDGIETLGQTEFTMDTR